MEPNIEGVDIWCFLLMLKFLQWYLLKVHVGTHMFFFFQTNYQEAGIYT